MNKKNKQKKLITFKEVLENKKTIDDKITYKCNFCNKLKSNKPWSIYYNDKYKCNKSICSYLCHKKETEIYPNLWDNLVNKEDFNLPIPIVNNIKKKFEILSKFEIQNLNEIEKMKYYKELNNFYNENPDRVLLLLNIQKSMDESEYIYSSDSDTDLY